MRTFTQTIGFTSCTSRNMAKVMAASALLIGVAGFASSARADNVQWSVGIGGPGVTIGMTNARPLPIFVQPQPYYGQPVAVYMQPGAIYTQQMPIYVQPAPIYRSGWAHQGRGHGMGPRHDRRSNHRAQGRGPSRQDHER